jgi:WD40 repeat protein
VDSVGNVAFYAVAGRENLAALKRVMHRRAHQDHGRSIAFSPDGELAASAAEDIVLWNARTGEKIARMEHTAIVWSVAFSPDGRWLVSSHGDGAVLIWDVAERALAASLNQHSGAVRAVAFQPGSGVVASGSEDRTVTLWDSHRGVKLQVLSGHQTRVVALSYSADGTTFGSLDQDGGTILWSAKTRTPQVTIPPSAAAYSLAISPDGKTVATTRGIYRAEDGRMLQGFLGNPDWPFDAPYGIAFSKDGRHLAAATESGWVLVWDGPVGRSHRSHRLDGVSHTAIAIAPDGESLVTGDTGGSVRLWALEPLREVAILGRHAARVKSVAFAPDGATVASAGDDEMIALWDVEGRRMLTRIGTHVSPVYSIAFSADGRRLASAEHDRTVRVYDRRRMLWGIPLD